MAMVALLPSGESGCCLKRCCSIDDCDCRTSDKIELSCCCLSDMFGVDYCSGDGGKGCMTEEFECEHICCSVRFWGCCNPCYLDGGCRLEPVKEGFDSTKYKCFDHHHNYIGLSKCVFPFNLEFNENDLKFYDPNGKER